MEKRVEREKRETRRGNKYVSWAFSAQTHLDERIQEGKSVRANSDSNSRDNSVVP